MATDLLLKYALQRRALAYEMARIATYDTMDAWSETLLRHYLDEAKPGFSRVSLEQLVDADKKMFQLIADHTRCGIRRNASGVLPIDLLLEKFNDSSQVLFYLQPRMRGSSAKEPTPGASSQVAQSSGSQAAAKPASSARAKKRARNNDARAAATWHTAPAVVAKAQTGGGKGAGKAAGKTGAKMPAALIGMASRDQEGNNICFAFNLAGGCALGVESGRCAKGRHAASRAASGPML